MGIKISELQALISKQKELAGVNFFGAFRDGYIAALDIVNVFVKAHEAKCVECQSELSEEEIAEGNGTCEICYQRLMAEHNAESIRNR